jgi:hypothetical protein
MRKKPHGALVPMIAVDREAEEPLHRQIYDAFRAMILERRSQPGQQIPSTRAWLASCEFREFPHSAPTLNSSLKGTSRVGLARAPL